MKQITVISGKGGTGKTSLVGAFAALTPSAVLADCDVDAANLHLLICDGIDPCESEPFRGSAKADVDRSLCTGCGWCESACRFGAIRLSAGGRPDETKACVNTMSCEGCGTCRDGCPSGAVELKEHRAGSIMVTTSRFGPLVHAQLEPGEGSSGKLVTRVRSRAKAVAEDHGSDLIIIDGSPGIGCPVIASITGVDGVLVVTEPTVSGRSDLWRALNLCRHFSTPAWVIINKGDLNMEMTEDIRGMCRSSGIPVVGTFGFDPVFVDAMIAGRTVVELGTGRTVLQLRQVWSRLRHLLGDGALHDRAAPGSPG